MEEDTTTAEIALSEDELDEIYGGARPEAALCGSVDCCIN